MLSLFQKLLPRISATEKIALRCGTRSLDANIFQNNVRSVLSSYQNHLTPKEEEFLNQETRDLCRMRFGRTQEPLSDVEMKFIREKGFLGLCLPPSFEGKGFSSYAHSRIVEKIASSCISSSVTVMVPNSLGPGELLVKYGTEEQQQKYLKKLATGQMLPCFGLTGPHNGSDALGALDKARLVDAHTLEFECNKRWITLAPVADLVGLAVDVEGHGVTVLLLERDEVDWEMGPRHLPVGAQFMNGTIRTTKPVRVSTQKVLGGPSNMGKGWEMLMECLSEGRGISLPALSVGVGCVLTLQTSYYARARKQFKIPLSQMQGVQEKLGRMVANTYTTLAMHELFNATLLRGEKSSVLSAILKYRTTELARETVLHGMDIFAGKGITTGPRNPIASIYTQIPIAITVEGSNTLTRSLIVFAQGINKSHPYVGDMVEALEHDDATRFYSLLPKMVGYVAYHYARLWNPFLDSLDRRNSLFIVVSSMMLFKGGRLKKEQMQTGRMADWMSQLYTAYALLWFQKNSEMESLLLQNVLHEMDNVAEAIGREEGLLFRLLFTPYRHSPPLSDAQWVQLSQKVLEDDLLDRLLASYIYLDPRDPIARFRKCYRNGKEASPTLIEEIVHVDVYPPETFVRK